MEIAKRDIKTSEDIVLLVDKFYEKVKENETIGYIFEDVAKVDWSKHLSKMYFFWGSILLGEKSYNGNPMKIHVGLSAHTQMSEVEFSQWLLLFNQTLDELFFGAITEEAKIRAANIARLMLFKIASRS